MPNNYYGDFLGQNMMQFQITEDMPLEKKLWRTYKHIWLGGEQVMERCLTKFFIVVVVVLQGVSCPLMFVVLLHLIYHIILFQLCFPLCHSLSSICNDFITLFQFRFISTFSLSQWSVKTTSLPPKIKVTSSYTLSSPTLTCKITLDILLLLLFFLVTIFINYQNSITNQSNYHIAYIFRKKLLFLLHYYQASSQQLHL